MARFDTTRWSMVLEARKEPAQARRALDTLCRNYRPPVLAYIRSHGYAGDAEDLTQAFFTRFVEQAYHRNADPERGRFRAYLLTALKRFLLDAEDQAHAVKRGGRVRRSDLLQPIAASSDWRSSRNSRCSSSPSAAVSASCSRTSSRRRLRRRWTATARVLRRKFNASATRA